MTSQPKNAAQALIDLKFVISSWVNDNPDWFKDGHHLREHPQHILEASERDLLIAIAEGFEHPIEFLLEAWGVIDD